MIKVGYISIIYAFHQFWTAQKQYKNKKTLLSIRLVLLIGKNRFNDNF